MLNQLYYKELYIAHRLVRKTKKNSWKIKSLDKVLKKYVRKKNCGEEESNQEHTVTISARYRPPRGLKSS